MTSPLQMRWVGMWPYCLSVQGSVSQVGGPSWVSAMHVYLILFQLGLGEESQVQPPRGHGVRQSAPGNGVRQSAPGTRSSLALSLTLVPSLDVLLPERPPAYDFSCQPSLSPQCLPAAAAPALPARFPCPLPDVPLECSCPLCCSTRLRVTHLL